MVIEIDVRIQLLAIQIFVRAASNVFRIVQQIRNAGDAAHQFQKFRAADHLVELGVGRSQASQVGEHGFAARFAAFVESMSGVEGRELGHEPAAKFWIQKLVDRDVAERLAGGELAVQFGNPVGDAWVKESQHHQLV